MALPGLKIVIPSTPYDCKGLLKSSIRDDDPVLFFEHKKSYRRLRGEVPDHDYVIPLGKADVKRSARLALDTDAIKQTVARTSKVLILYEDNKTGGIGAEVAVLIAEDVVQAVRRLAAY